MFMWIRGGQGIDDAWCCLTCDIYRPIKRHDDQPAIEHVRLTGHDVTIVYITTKSFAALRDGITGQPRPALPRRIPGTHMVPQLRRKGL